MLSNYGLWILCPDSLNKGPPLPPPSCSSLGPDVFVHFGREGGSVLKLCKFAYPRADVNMLLVIMATATTAEDEVHRRHRFVADREEVLLVSWCIQFAEKFTRSDTTRRHDKTRASASPAPAPYPAGYEEQKF